MKKLALRTAVLALLTTSWTHAGDNQFDLKETGKLTLNGKLTDADPADSKFKESKQKTHTIKFTGQLEKGKYCKFEVRSADFAPYVTLLNEEGKPVDAEKHVEGEAGKFATGQVIHRISKAGTFKIKVAASDERLGAYEIIVAEATPAELVKWKANTFAIGKTAEQEREDVMTEITGYLVDKAKAGKLGISELAIAEAACEGLGETKQAARHYEKLSELLLKNSSHDLVLKNAAFMKGCARRLNLEGNEIDVKGTLMDGKAIDWKAYRGKVVLVDFWSTLCIPCIREFPNLKRNLAAYKERGFDIVAVSIDQNRAALEKFLAREKLPWVCIHEKNVKGAQPLELHYGIRAIPQTILVGRDGKVISLDARGENLDRLLEKHIGPVAGK